MGIGKKGPIEPTDYDSGLDEALAGVKQQRVEIKESEMIKRGYKISSFAFDIIRFVGSLPTTLVTYAFSNLTAGFINFVIKSTKKAAKNPKDVQQVPQKQSESQKIKDQTLAAYKQGEIKTPVRINWIQSITGEKKEGLYVDKLFLKGSIYVKHFEEEPTEYFVNEPKIKAIFTGPPGLHKDSFLPFMTEKLPEKLRSIGANAGEEEIERGLERAIQELNEEYQKKTVLSPGLESLLCFFDTGSAIYIVNLGNTRAILVDPQKGVSKQLTEDTDPIQYRNMELTQVFPKITKVVRSENKGSYIVFGTNMLWGYLNNAAVASAIKRMRDGGISYNEMGLYIADAMAHSQIKGNFAVGVIHV